ncbi:MULTISPECIES: TonB-dependent receptor plug domain-containing protein [Halanaerobium]|jgi:outer membrane receptor for ferrienterochelin and colicins|uniref:TonB-dependent receptor plug domain-containing protein n=1 Tax=Halanaerobium TaxID=2330 RepID=UPI000880394B|nr:MULTISPECIES: TonB-dependent receptor [Halanaerobium]PUU86306.1 MAG: iron complex outermembrane recepter protein [Halanaerobium sp.]SDK36865.1 outer membrane receptor for ferrienterochelin and colicins [Halanaerobium congolense]SDM00562.1 outer membrane receptor for ferrienterochelin and colicins [Halanaerobium congolense]
MLKKKVLVMLTALLILAVPVSAQEEVVDLEEVVVTASRYEESIMETPVSIEVIDQEEIEESNAQNLADLLQDAGGVYIKNFSGLTGKKDVIIRGARQDQILYLLDGQPLNSPQDGIIRLEDIPISIIKRIEISKSASSSIYGANAMGGVINIVTQDTDKDNETEINFGLGSYNTQNYIVTTNYNFDNSSIFISYDKLSSDEHRDDPDQKSSLDRDDIFLKYKYNLSKISNVNITYRHNNTESNYPGSEANDDYGFRDDQDENIKISLNQNLENRDRTFLVYNNEREMYDKTRSTWSLTGYNTTDIDISKRGFNYKETNYYFDNHTINYGFDIIENKVEDNTISINNKYDNLNKALYIQDKFRLNNNIFVYGARYDDHDEYGSNLSPKLGYIYEINDNWNFNFNYGEAFRAPTFLDLYTGFGNNENLNPEEAKTFDIGFKYSDSICRREITFFRRKFDQLITYNSNTLRMENIDEADIKGIEFLTSRTFDDNWNIDFAYTYLEARDDSVDGQSLNMPYNQLALNLKYRTETYKAVLDNRYVDETNSYGGGKVDSYFISDLKLSTNIDKNKELAFEINNLFDKDYEVVDGYPMPGRNFMVNLSTKF